MRKPSTWRVVKVTRTMIHVTDLSKKMQWQVSGGDCGLNLNYSAGMDDLAGRVASQRR